MGTSKGQRPESCQETRAVVEHFLHPGFSPPSSVVFQSMNFFPTMPGSQVALGFHFGQWSQSVFPLLTNSFHLWPWPRVNIQPPFVLVVSFLCWCWMPRQWHRWPVFLLGWLCSWQWLGMVQPTWTQTMRCGALGWKEPVLGPHMNFWIQKLVPWISLFCPFVCACGGAYRSWGPQLPCLNISLPFCIVETIIFLIRLSQELSEVVSTVFIMVDMPTGGVLETFFTFPLWPFGVCGRWFWPVEVHCCEPRPTQSQGLFLVVLVLSPLSGAWPRSQQRLTHILT